MATVPATASISLSLLVGPSQTEITLYAIQNCAEFADGHINSAQCYYGVPNDPATVQRTFNGHVIGMDVPDTTHCTSTAVGAWIGYDSTAHETVFNTSAVATFAVSGNNVSLTIKDATGIAILYEIPLQPIQQKFGLTLTP